MGTNYNFSKRLFTNHDDQLLSRLKILKERLVKLLECSESNSEFLTVDRYKKGPSNVQTLSLFSKVKTIALDDSYLVAVSDVSMQVFKREQLEEVQLMINTNSFNCMSIALSTNFIIACDGTREVRIWKKLDGEILTTFCINYCTDNVSIRCGTNDLLIAEYMTYAPKPSMFTYQVKSFVPLED